MFFLRRMLFMNGYAFWGQQTCLLCHLHSRNTNTRLGNWYMTVTEQLHVNCVSLAINHAGRCERTLRVQWIEKCIVGVELAFYVCLCSTCSWYEHTSLPSQKWIERNAEQIPSAVGGKKRQLMNGHCLVWLGGIVEWLDVSVVDLTSSNSSKRNWDNPARTYTYATARRPVDCGVGRSLRLTFSLVLEGLHHEALEDNCLRMNVSATVYKIVKIYIIRWS